MKAAARNNGRSTATAGSRKIKPGAASTSGSAFSEEDLKRVYIEKVRFNQEVLGLPEDKARKWAERTRQIFEESDLEFEGEE